MAISLPTHSPRTDFGMVKDTDKNQVRGFGVGGDMVFYFSRPGGFSTLIMNKPLRGLRRFPGRPHCLLMSGRNGELNPSIGAVLPYSFFQY